MSIEYAAIVCYGDPELTALKGTSSYEPTWLVVEIGQRFTRLYDPQTRWACLTPSTRCIVYHPLRRPDWEELVERLATMPHPNPFERRALEWAREMRDAARCRMDAVEEPHSERYAHQWGCD